MSFKFRLGLALICCLVMSASAETSSPDIPDILGCGGFVRSSYKLDFDKIEIKLFTKQGSLKVKTECAPTTGYYFMPLEAKGDYVLKISPPEGWTFDPAEYHIRFDGVSDDCSKGIDKNFDFKGFSVFGKVVTKGFAVGPDGVQLDLSGPENLKLTKKTNEGGSFSFDSMPPGVYSLKANHPSLSFGKDSFSFEISNKNVIVENQITVLGYEVIGRVRSDKTFVEGVTFVLLGSSDADSATNCDKSHFEGFEAPFTAPNKFLCHQPSDKAGIFRFSGLKPGKYSVVPVYKGKNIVYNVSPDRLDFELKHASLELEKGFEVEGFTVQGSVKGVSGANILVNGELRATSGANGHFEIAKMKAGTYNIDITAEKIQFDTKKVVITPTNPVIPEFIPSRFLMCGHIELIPSSHPPPQMTLFFQETNPKGKAVQAHSEKVTNPKRTCIFLLKGNYVVSVESQPAKYFTPGRHVLEVPSENEFAFQQFSGHIAGSVKGSSAYDVTVVLKSVGGGNDIISKQEIKGGGSFKFSNLESQEYQIEVVQSKFCWTKEVLKVFLKNQNVDSVIFEQKGYSLLFSTSHDTKIHVFTVGKTKVMDEFDLKASQSKLKVLCLNEAVEIEPRSCHVFDKPSYSFKPGQDENEVKLVAKSHTYSGFIIANAEVPDLQVNKNGELLDKSFVTVQKQKKDKTAVTYEVNVVGSPGTPIKLNFFSYGFIFEPAFISLEPPSDCQNAMFQVSAKKSHVIKGKLTPPLDGAEIKIELVGDPQSTTFVTTNEAGEYIAGPFIHNSGFKATPQKSGYTFRPVENDPFSFTVLRWARIIVKVEDESNSSLLPNVLLSLSGPSAYRQNRLTDPNGELVFGDLQPGEYYLKALLREFSFKPSALHIELKEQEGKVLTLQARRESFSLYGQLSSLTGDLMPNLLVSARGQTNCSEYGEEGTSDELGNFRIWSLKSYCNYEISVVKKDDFALRVERTIPDVLNVKVENQDLHNISMIIITPVKRMDITLRVLTKNPKNLDSLKALIYSSHAPDMPLHVVQFNGISYIILPPIPKDSAQYFITFESTLSPSHYDYTLPEQINFTASQAYAHYTVNFDVEIVHSDQVIGKSSYFAFAFIIFVFLVITYFDKIGRFLREFLEKLTSGASSATLAAKKSKGKSKLQ